MAFDRRETATLLIGDFLLLIVSLWVALTIRNAAIPTLSYFEQNLLPFFPMFCIFLATFYAAGLYEKQTRPVKSLMGVRVFGAQLANATIAAVLFFMLPLTIEPKTILLIFVAVSSVAISLWRFYHLGRELRESERLPALLLGQGPAVDELYEEVNGNGRYRIRFVVRSNTFVSLPEVGVVVVDTFDPRTAHALPTLYTTHGARAVIEFASLYEEVFDRVPLAHMGGESITDALARRLIAYDITKRLFDIALSLIGILLALPFILFGIVGRLLTRTPVFFLHTRIGRGGKPFIMIKLGSMLLNDHGDPELQRQNRVTRFGSLLRRARIDELPQLWNILWGELSFIGPRPELPKIAEVYEREIPFYSLRHLVTPGLSGWAQIHDFDAPRGGADVERTKRKLSFDLYYLKRRSLGLDLAIAVQTLRALLSFSGT